MKLPESTLLYQADLKAKMLNGNEKIGQCFCGSYYTAKVWSTSLINRRLINYTLCMKCRKGQKKNG